VKGMERNSKLARAISDVGLGEFRRQLTYRCECDLTIDRDLNAAMNLNPVPKALREITPAEMTALRRSVHPVFVTSIAETGSQHQLLCG